MASQRSLDELSRGASEEVRHAIELLQQRYGASSYQESGHREGAGGRPTVIFDLPNFGAEVGLPMNKRDLTLYMRNRTMDGRKLTDLLPDEKVVNVYPRDGKPARSINESKFLGPPHGNETVRLKLKRADLEPLFAQFFATVKSSECAVDAQATEPLMTAIGGALSQVVPTGQVVTRAAIDAESFEALLDRRSEVGMAGELWVVQDELQRLKLLGCPDPHRWVERVALTDVGRGYDIASTWPGQERCIEVKSSTSRDGDFYLTENECRVMSQLGPRAWLYRVWVRNDGRSEVLTRLQDPMASLAPSAFKPVVYRVEAVELKPPRV